MMAIYGAIALLVITIVTCYAMTTDYSGALTGFGPFCLFGAGCFACASGIWLLCYYWAHAKRMSLKVQDLA